MVPVRGKKAGEVSVLIREGGFTVKNILTPEEMIQAYHLRHRIFSQELKWVPPSEDALERDVYDEGGVFFGVFDEDNRLRAFLRLILPERPFMIEREFLSLVSSDHRIRKEDDTVEVSRLCVAPEARTEIISGNFGVHAISLLLYKGVYRWCRANWVRHLYLVVEQRIFRMLRAKGFPCELVGEPQVMPDGVVAVAAIMDWKRFEELCAGKRPALLEWFSQAQSAPAQGQRRLHESGLRYSVSA